MAGLTNQESASTLDARFPTTAATDFIGYSTNGTSEFAGLARTSIGATGWAAATVADPSVKANAVALTSAVATAGGTITHVATFSAATAGNMRTDWNPVATPKTVGVGDTLTHAAGTHQITLT